jgi:glycosyltransferase involved in cell wall biosynthesis
MKKILIFSLAYYPSHVGGAEVAIKEITDRIDSGKYEFHLLCLRFDLNLPKKEKIGNVLVHRIGFSRKNPSMEDLKKFPLHLNKYLFQLYAGFYAIKLHKLHKYDAIWAMMAHSCGVPAAIFKIFNKKVKYILTLQEGDPPEKIEAMMKKVWPLFKRAFTLADIVQPISSFLEKWARDMGFKGKAIVIPNGFSQASLQVKCVDESKIQRLKEKLGKKSDDIFLVTVSRLVYKNAIDDCIRAIKLLPENIKFIVVGDGPDSDMLKKLANDIGVAKRIKFVGQVDRSETALYRRVSDIFIRPSRSEGMGNSFISTMVAKLPIIATQVGGIADFLFDAAKNPDKTTTGWAVDSNRPDQIATAVTNIIANPKKVKKVVDSAYELAVTKYDWKNIAKDMENKIFD